MNIFELFDNSVPWEYTATKPQGITAEFDIDGNHYTVMFINHPEPYPERQDVFTVDFAVGAWDGDTWLSYNTGVTGTGNEYKVFSTVLEIIKTTVDKFGIGVMKFTSDNVHGTSSRTTLYKRMVRTLSSSWDAKITDRPLGTEYLLTKK